MLELTDVAIISTVCFIGAYGIQNRRRWAWYGGWVVAFFMAAAVSTLALQSFDACTTILEIASFCGGMAALITVWVGWASWWARHREEFGITQED